jgi:hypothetical protein
MTDCPECAQLREESALVYSEYVSCKDELAITDKADKAFVY